MPLLSVVIPAHNEETTIRQVIAAVRRNTVENSFLSSQDLEIIVVDDKSSDKTGDILRKLHKEKQINKVLFKKENTGKGDALRLGFKFASGEIVLIQDADLEYSPEDYPRLLLPILEEKADVVYGSRFIGAQPHRVLYFWHFVANRILTIWSNIFTNVNISDMETGYKVFRKEILDQIEIKEQRFGIEPEITVKVAAMKARIYEVGISYHGRTYQEGKKIGLKDFFEAVWVVVKYAWKLG